MDGIFVLPKVDDVKAGVASVHSKLWTAGDPLKPIEQELQDMWQEKKKEMDVYYKKPSQAAG